MSPKREADVTLTSRRHPLILRFRRIAGRPAVARRSSILMIDGRHLIEEALAANLTPDAVLFTDALARTSPGRGLVAQLRSRRWPLFRVTEEVLAVASQVDTPPGIAGLFRRPAPLDLTRPPAPSLGSIQGLVLAGVQDPVNLGALARASWAFGCPALITLPGTVDPYHPRAVRASSGMVLRLAIASEVGPERLRAWLTVSGVRLLALVPHAGRPLESLNPARRALLLGAEGCGVPKELEKIADETGSLMMRTEADSIGVAAAGTIALYLLSGKDRRAGTSQAARNRSIESTRSNRSRCRQSSGRGPTPRSSPS